MQERGNLKYPNVRYWFIWTIIYSIDNQIIATYINQMYKYKIRKCLDALTYTDYIIIKKMLPGLLKVSTNTLINYMNIKLDDSQDIPYRIVRQLEQIFGIEQGTLSNGKFESKHYFQLLKEWDNGNLKFTTPLVRN